MGSPVTLSVSSNALHESIDACSARASFDNLRLGEEARGDWVEAGGNARKRRHYVRRGCLGCRLHSVECDGIRPTCARTGTSQGARTWPQPRAEA